MRLVWTVANWKRTGPVEPSLDLAAGLARRGHEVLVLTGAPPGGNSDDAGEAAEVRGLTRLRAGVALRKHRFGWRDRRDATRLADHLRVRPPDALVSTLANDHRIADRAVALAGTRTPIVRLWFEDGAAPTEPREALALERAAGIVAFGRGAATALDARGLGARASLLDPPIDVERLRRASTRVAEMRARHRAGDDRALFGLVARVQAHRRFDVLWEALARLRARGRDVRLLLVGRGTRFEAVAARPVRRLGLRDCVTPTGYLRGEEYASTIAALDAQLLLVPGTDPTCRAVREGMALGRAVAVGRVGLLPDLVEDGVTGLVFDAGPEPLAAALDRLAGDPALRERLGAAAAARAATELALPVVAARLEDVLRVAAGQAEATAAR